MLRVLNYFVSEGEEQQQVKNRLNPTKYIVCWIVGVHVLCYIYNYTCIYNIYMYVFIYIIYT